MRRLLLVLVALAAGCRLSPGGQCESLFDCRSGQACSHGVCVRVPSGGCASDGDCSSGDRCLELTCVPVDAVACTSDPACTVWQECRVGYCLTRAGACGRDADCASWQACSGVHACVAAAGRCGSAADCQAWQVCDSSYCATAPGFCASAADCASWQTCPAATHVCAPQPGRCGSSTDCAAWQTCDATNTCVLVPGRCGTAADCASWQTCDASHVCATAPGFCAAAADCASWQTCAPDSHTCATAPGACAIAADCRADETCSAAHACVATPLADHLSVGWAHVCLLRSGLARCWGNGYNAELGNGDTLDRTTPTPVAQTTSYTALACEDVAHCCAITTAGAAECWGTLGTAGTAGYRTTPYEMIPSGVAHLYAAGGATFAVMADGRSLAWGSGQGEIPGPSTGSDVLTPIEVFTPGEYAAFTAEQYYDRGYGITAAGGVQSWYGASAVADVAGLPPDPVQKVVGGNQLVCALTTAGEVWCWTTGGSIPVKQALPAGIVDLTVGESHVCVLNAARHPMCWGENGYGELGDGTQLTRQTPADVSWGSLGTVREIGAGNDHTCALLDDGTLYCWGITRTTNTGVFTDSMRLTPTQILW